MASVPVAAVISPSGDAFVPKRLNVLSVFAKVAIGVVDPTPECTSNCARVEVAPAPITSALKLLPVGCKKSAPERF